MVRNRLFLSLAFAVAGTLWASAPIASLNSAGPVTVQGVRVPASAATSIPLFSGEEVTTGAVGATIIFPDRSRVFLGSDSKVKLSNSGPTTVVRFEGGSSTYSLAPSSNLVLYDHNEPIQLPRGVVTGSSPSSSGPTIKALSPTDIGDLPNRSPICIFDIRPVCRN